MVFSSTVFLFCFLPAVCLLYFLVHRCGSLRNYVLVLMSLFFYAWGEPKNIAVLLWICALSFVGGSLLGRLVHWRRTTLFVFLVLELGTLGVFKYTDFFLRNLGRLLQQDFLLPHIALPIGISFFTFQAVSYLIDVYRRDVEPQRDPVKLVLYISFFPQLIAGPIVKYHEVEAYLTKPDLSLDNVVSGAERFIVGLGKKVLIANTLGQVADMAFTPGISLTTAAAWLGIVCYTLQIYYDFSGYSDMAIGLGRIFGFHFQENFNYPYMALSVTEHWRRWHISLGTWFKEYLYIPLGGSRCGKARTYLNLMFVFFVTGLWHGAGWTYVLWGCWHGVLVVAEKALGVREWGNRCAVIRHFYFVLVLLVGFVIFRSPSITYAFDYLQLMFSFTGGGTHPLIYFLNGKIVLLLILSLLFCSPVLSMRLSKILAVMPEWPRLLLRECACFVLLLLSIVYVASSAYNPFIYFRF